MDTYWFWTLLASFLCWILIIQFLYAKHNPRSDKQKLPPSPRAWPVIGHLHLASKLNHRGLRELSQKYGSIFMLRLGRVNMVVVSSAEMAKTILKTQDHLFCDRPKNSASENLEYNSSDIAFSPYGDRWRLLRKIANTHLLGSTALKSLMPFIEQHVCKVLVDPILEASRNSDNPQVTVNLNQILIKMATSLLSALVLGNEDWEGAIALKELAHEYSYLLATPDIGDFLPWLAWLDPMGLRRRQKLAAKKADMLYEQVIRDHAAKRGEKKRPDFVDALLDYEEQIGRNGMKALIIDMMHAGADTMNTAVEWAMSELLLHPDAMHKAQAELRSLLGPQGRVSHADLGSLPYLRAAMKEALRLHTPAPLLLPRHARADCQVAGYAVPRGTTVLVNVWAASRDPAVWGPRAEEFWPDRFEAALLGRQASASRYKAEEEEFLWPFGAGRRICPGVMLGSSVVELVLAQMLHCFDWRLSVVPAQEDLDMSDKLTLTLQRSTPLIAMATPRLPSV